MQRLIIFFTGASLIAVWLYLSLFGRSPVIKPEINKSKSSYALPDESKLKGCFPWSIYFLQSLEYRDDAIVCRGNLRGSTSSAFHLISENIQKAFGDRFLVLLQSEPRTTNQISDQNSEQEAIRSSFIIVPSFTPQSPFSQFHHHLVWFSSVMIGLCPLALLGLYYQASPLFPLLQAIAPILIICVVLRELGRRWVANRYKIKISLPHFMPHFGGVVWCQSHIPNRQALFDLAIAPNLVSLIIGICLVLFGLMQQPTHLGDLQGNLAVEFNFNASLLMMGLHQISPNSGNFLSPISWAGWWCLNLTTISLIPVSITDGGYLLRSIFGEGNMAIAIPIMRMILLGLGLISQPWLIIVAIALFLLNYSQPTPLDDVTELNLGRELWGILLLTIALAVVLPVPEFLT
ncbi:Peptidase family M50 [Synechococcus sp. PCC 7502]|uniref:site-2 protease family protein n=1 Tax=Synechococcus sp. PCC 7502 TaxID=1173263 RepID=UPI00029F9C12|nr:site-2 protease family protein [Synechococcus sp. PCC 7502]AFY73081.1 Peptidase family M50 [Synechococcus sp. PCC 7502]